MQPGQLAVRKIGLGTYKAVGAIRWERKLRRIDPSLSVVSKGDVTVRCDVRSPALSNAFLARDILGPPPFPTSGGPARFPETFLLIS